MLCWLLCSIPAWLCSLQGVGAAVLAWGSREMFLPYTFNCMHRVSSLGFSQLPSAREDLGFGPASECPKRLSAQEPWPYGEPQQLFPWKRPGHLGKDQLYGVLFSMRHEPLQGLWWLDHTAPGFKGAGRCQLQ